MENNISKYGGNSTNIHKAFQHLDTILDEQPSDNEYTVIFISDGGHNVGGNIDELLTKLKGNHRQLKLNFICLGVGKGFPTKISMTLKEKYHCGDPSMPSIFLIEYCSDEAF